MGPYRDLDSLPHTDFDPFLCTQTTNTKAIQDQHVLLHFDRNSRIISTFERKF